MVGRGDAECGGDLGHGVAAFPVGAISSYMARGGAMRAIAKAGGSVISGDLRSGV
jgi:hypothetical protein